MPWASSLGNENGSNPQELDRISTLLIDKSSEEHDSGPVRELSILPSLSHTDPHLSASSFSVEDFLVSRSHTSLSDLRLELRDYLAVLKEELVQLINDDYAAFISLSTDLRGEGARLERLKFPLDGVRKEIKTSLDELKLIQETVQERLNERSALREEKVLLHLLLQLSEYLARLENLLLITPPPQDSIGEALSAGSGLAIQMNPVQSEDRDDRSRTNRVKHLSRVATEFTQLLYLVDKAKSEECAFVDEIQWAYPVATLLQRVERIKSTLSSDLDHLFATTLLSLTLSDAGGPKTPLSEPEKARLRSDLKECLRTYDALGCWRDAEEVVRREVMRGFVKKTIFSGALAVPHSPLMPRTPFPTSNMSACPPTPGTPYTPFTARLRRTPFELQFALKPETRLPLLDGSNDALASLYNKVLRFIERDLKGLMELGESISVRHRRAIVPIMPGMNGHATHDDALEWSEGFEFTSNVIWDEVGRAVMDELGPVIFAVGRPDEFRDNYATTQSFLVALEYLAPSIHAVESMRCHKTYLAFQRRWQLPVYFQLRWKEIVSKLEGALSSKSPESDNAIVKDNSQGVFSTPHAAAVFDAIQKCWSAEVFIPELGHRFWRLTLQTLSRYKSWLELNNPPSEPPAKVVAAIAVEKAGTGPGTPSSRSPTPVPLLEASGDSTVDDEALLKRSAIIISDIKTLERKVNELFLTEISAMLPDVVDGEDETSPSEALKSTLKMLTEMIPALSSHIVATLTRRSCEALVLVRAIPSQYRAMSSKRLPTESSHFVPNILRPVKVFLGGGESSTIVGVKKEFGSLWATEIFEAVCQRYVSYLVAMKKTEESLRRLKKGKMSAFSLFGSGLPTATKNQESKDEERIRVQMVLDVTELGKDARSLGIDIENNAAFQELTTMVSQDHTEDT